MGGQSSETKRRDQEPSSQASTDSQFEAKLRSYEAACGHDPALQDFDKILHQRANRVIGTLAGGLGVQSLSFDSLKEITGCLLETNQEVVKIILESRENIWKNRHLFSLVEEYFDNSAKALEFCTALQGCLNRARNNQLIIQLAVKYFEEEVGLQVSDEKKFVKTLEELRKFKAAEQPFSKQFFLLFNSLHMQQKLMLEKLLVRQRKLKKRLKSSKILRRVSNVLFAATFVSVLIFSVVAAAIAAPTVVTVLAGAMEVPMSSVGKWCNRLWKRYENELKGQEDLVTAMWIRARITVCDMDDIKVHISQLEIQIESMSFNANFALEGQDAIAVKLAIDEVKRKLEAFVDAIKNLAGRANMCTTDIIKGRAVILEKITTRSGTSTTGDSLQ